MMKCLWLVLLALFTLPLTARAQTGSLRSVHSEPKAATRAITALKSLESEVIVYNSLGDFEADRRPARVSLEAFRADLQKVSGEVENALSQLTDDKFKNEISNALHSFQDGAYWWGKSYQPRVVNISELASSSRTEPAAAAYEATIPYTVVINWRQASRSIRRAEAANPQ